MGHGSQTRVFVATITAALIALLGFAQSARAEDAPPAPPPPPAETTAATTTTSEPAAAPAAEPAATPDPPAAESQPPAADPPAETAAEPPADDAPASDDSAAADPAPTEETAPEAASCDAASTDCPAPVKLEDADAPAAAPEPAPAPAAEATAEPVATAAPVAPPIQAAPPAPAPEQVTTSVVIIVAELPAPEGADAETATPKDELAPETNDVAAVALNPLKAPSVGLSSPAPAPRPAREPKVRVLAVAADLNGCAQPTGRVPLSDACTRARTVSPLLPAVQLPTSLPAAVAAISRATREVARQRDTHEAAERDVQKKPPSVVAVPAGTAQDDTLAAGGGSGGGSTSGTRTLRIDAIHQRISPLRPPSTFTQAPVPELVPTGELEVPPTARPG